MIGKECSNVRPLKNAGTWNFRAQKFAKQTLRELQSNSLFHGARACLSGILFPNQMCQLFCHHITNREDYNEQINYRECNP